jgi:Ca-activated chloride channel family protein
MKKTLTALLAILLVLLMAACSSVSTAIQSAASSREAVGFEGWDTQPSESAAAESEDWGALSSEAPAASSAASSSAPASAQEKVRNDEAAELDNSINTYESDESYAAAQERGFRPAVSQPLSTFSIDVDTASYSNIRRYLQQGQMPPEDAVRIEEMVNYFHYNYPEPVGQIPFALQARVMACPWNKAHLLAVIGLKGKDVHSLELPRSNLVFLIDVSGSMGDEDKLPLLKTAFSLLTNELADKDTVSIVAYAGKARVALQPTKGSDKTKILRAIDTLTAGGNTAGGKGIQTAYDLAEQNFIKSGNNRVILATDGDFNVGVSSLEELEDLISQEKDKGIFLSVLGFGEGNLKDDSMETLADKGNGNYAYIDSISEAQKVLVSERSGTLNTIAKDVKIQVEFNPSMVQGYRLVGYENRVLKKEDFDDDAKDAGELGAGHTVTALYEIMPADGKSPLDELKYQQPVLFPSDEWMTVHLRYKEPQGSESRELQKSINKAAYTLNPTQDMLFAAAVAEFGLLLKDSDYQGKASYKNVLSMAKESLGADTDGYRREFISLVEKAWDIGE